MVRRRSLAERLGFLGLGCFGVRIYNADLEGENGVRIYNANLDGENGAQTELNLPENVVAEEQQFLAMIDDESGQVLTRSESFPGLTSLVPLIRLIEVKNFEDEVEETIGERSLGNFSVCCMCMERKKRSELVPCRHTFCRGCARKLWFDRGTCPLCFHWIKDYLDLF